jgi:hypothetical protein
MPIRMSVQLLPALVVGVQGVKEGDRIGDMDQDRDP